MTASSGHLEALCAKHLALEKKIREEQNSPSMSAGRLKLLKREKLRIKDEIEGEQRQGRA